MAKRMRRSISRPAQSKEFSVKLADDSLKPEHEYVLDFRFNLADGTPWASAGHELAWAQFELSAKKIAAADDR